MMTTSLLPIEFSLETLAAFCQQNKIRRLSFFGSVLRDDFRSDSDVDCLVEFVPNAIVTLFDMGRIERELSPVLDRRKVDLHTPAELSPYIRERVLAEALVQYGD
ncbi:MAG: nucleotidyltransferase family protein [Acaryochloridaceae cyanobacterium RL_2_7]|nr:nucleotidyltransferase family protein [Acaryochloridaceae cyanobacterium RL_2_7]